jgi:hypothetical protein
MFASSLEDLASKKKPTLVMRTESVAFYAPGPDGDEYLLFYREGALMLSNSPVNPSPSCLPRDTTETTRLLPPLRPVL